MCRSIKKLRHADHRPSEEELFEAARQFVRKISGYREPSHVNEAAFHDAIEEIVAASRRMFDRFVVRGWPDEAEAERHEIGI